jgi:hypothetical protein
MEFSVAFPFYVGREDSSVTTISEMYCVNMVILKKNMEKSAWS